MKKLIIVLLAFLTATAAVAQQAEIYPQIGPEARIRSVSYSPDGKFILTASGQGSVKIWSVETRRELKTLYTSTL